MKQFLIWSQLFFILFSAGCARPPQKQTVSAPVAVPPAVVEPAEIPAPVKPPIPKKTKARVAIIIDDAGHNLKPMSVLLNLPVRFDIAVLPKLKYSKEVAEQLYAAGYEIMLHQPMEPKNASIDPGPGAILTDMNEEQIQAILEENIKSIPNLVGVNNHMGSKATSSLSIMEVVLKTTEKNKLFFIDSLTSRSKVKEAAEAVGVSVAARDIFLDNDKNPEAIKKQLRKLKNVALSKGSAIGIGHFFPVTIQSISEILPEFEEEGVEVVPVSQLIE